jgi:hypothetical protein
MSSRILHPGSVALLHGVQLRPAKIVFFCDESGRTGDNYLDEQRLHVIAGYLVGEAWFPKLAALVSAVRSQRGDTEVKAADLLATSGGRHLLNNFIVEADRLFIPVVVAIDKRYYAAIRLSRLLLAPAFNPRARDLRLADGGAEMVVEAFVAASTARTVKSFIEAVRAGSVESFQYLLLHTTEDLRRAGYNDLRRRVEAVRPNLRRLAAASDAELLHWDIKGPRGGVFRVGATIDFDAFLHSLTVMNRLIGALRGPGQIPWHVEVICDDPQGVEAFARLFGALKGSGQLEHLGALKTGDSAAHAGLQAADFLAGTVRYTFERAQIAKELVESADALAWAFFSTPPKGRSFLPPDEYRRLAVRSANFWRGRQRMREALVRIIKTRATQDPSGGLQTGRTR